LIASTTEERRPITLELAEGLTVSPHIARSGKHARRAAALLLSLLAVDCAPSTRGSAPMSSGGSTNAPAARTGPSASSAGSQGMMVRISEIRIEPDRLEEYRAILREEAEASVRLEPGVISIFPMYERERPTEVRILEIYASRAAYESHLQTPHFQKYKTTTLPMVRSLRLVDMEAMDPATMSAIFGKMPGGR
jgi:quinol monooxygenase YgiN